MQVKEVYRFFITGLKGAALGILLLFSNYIVAQSTSPYSRFGLGYINSTAFSGNKALGGVSAAYQSSQFINYTNPASYPYLGNFLPGSSGIALGSATIDIGANVEGVSIGTKDSIYKGASGNINHFAIAFVPKPKHNNNTAWAVSLGILPYSNIHYDFVQDITDTTIGNHTQTFSGRGGLYQVYAGGGYRVGGFSFGANLGYVFGKLSYLRTAVFPDSTGALNTRDNTNVNLKGVTFTIGVQYRGIIKKNSEASKTIYAIGGAYVNGASSLTAKISDYWDRFHIDVDNNVISDDTIVAAFNKKGKITMPYGFGAGLMFGNERFWMLGADFKFTNWKTYTTPLDNGGLGNSWRVSVGGQITPKDDDQGHYLRHIQYRAGAYFGKSEVMYNGKNLNEAAGTLGLNFPLKKEKATTGFGALNVTGEFGSRNAADKNAIRENFYRFTFGFVLSDIGWFNKRKFE